MTVMIALFRGINVGGNRVAMAALRDLLVETGCAGVETYIQSGNAVFTAAGEPAALAERIEAAFAARFGFGSTVVLVTGTALAAALAANPFREADAAPTSVHLGFFRTAPPASYTDDLAGIASGRDSVRLIGGVLYLSTPDGMARSKLAEALLKPRRRPPVTLRNWRTAGTLRAMADARAGG